MRQGDQCRRAFTLVELLVSIAVIALLVGVLVPAISGVRVRAMVVVDLNNLHQLGLLTGVYTSAHDDALYRSSHSYFAHRSRGARPWFRDVYELITEQPYEGPTTDWVRVLDASLRNPLDPRRAPKYSGPFDPEYNGSYALNVYYELSSNETTDGRTWRRVAMIPSPTRAVLFGETDEGTAGTMARDHIMAHFWAQRMAPPGEEIARERNRPNAGYLYLDGHANNIAFDVTFDLDTPIDDWNPGG